jgi:hypothetical protein
MPLNGFADRFGADDPEWAAATMPPITATSTTHNAPIVRRWPTLDRGGDEYGDRSGWNPYGCGSPHGCAP